MTPTAFSYVSGVSAEPLLGSTIGQALASAAERWPERPALISPSHGVAWTWKELRARTRDLAAGLLALGLRRGERIGVWSLNRPEWTLTQFAAAEAGLVFVTINPAYRLHELEYALKKVGCAALVVATRFKTSDFIGMVNALAPELASAKPGALKAQKLPDLRIVAQIGETAAGTLAFEEVARIGGAGELRGAGGDARRNSVRRRRQHSVHQRHDRFAQGRHAQPPQHPQQRLFHRPCDAADARGPHLHSGAAVSLLRHGDGQSGGGYARRGDGLSRRGLRSAGDPEDRGVPALHGAVRRPHNVYRRARPSGIWQLRSLLVADGHHGGRALSDRGDAESDRAHAHARRDDRLWHDRDEPGQLPEFDRGHDRAPRLDDRPRAFSCRGEGDRPTGPHSSARESGANSARAAIP